MFIIDISGAQKKHAEESAQTGGCAEGSVLCL